MPRRLAASGAALALLGMGVTWAGLAAAADPRPASPPAHIAPLGRDHELSGRVVRIADRATIDPARLIGELRRADFVLLGEKHDNPDHHALQAWTVEALIASGRRPAVVFEMLDTEQAPAVARYLAGGAIDASGLGPAVGWEASGWPDWSLYAPIAAAALRAGLPVAAGDLPREAKRGIGRGGLDSLAEATRARLGLATSFDADQTADLSNELRASHCGQLPEAALPRMRDVQRARDAHMAAALIEAAARPGVDGAVLIAGAGHVRRDRGVPWHLARLAPTRSVASVVFAEVDRDRRDAAEYMQGQAIEYLWFTPRVDDDDPCAKFADQLQRLRRP